MWSLETLDSFLATSVAITAIRINFLLIDKGFCEFQDGLTLARPIMTGIYITRLSLARLLT